MSSVSAPGGRGTGARIVAAILVVIAILAVVAGIIYLTKTSESLPGFLPGRRPGHTGHDNVRGVAAIVVAVLALIGAGFALAAGRRAKTPQG